MVVINQKLTSAHTDALLHMATQGYAERSSGMSWNIGGKCFMDQTIQDLVDVGLAKYDTASVWRGGIQIPARARIAN